MVSSLRPHPVRLLVSRWSNTTKSCMCRSSFAALNPSKWIQPLTTSSHRWLVRWLCNHLNFGAETAPYTVLPKATRCPLGTICWLMREDWRSSEHVCSSAAHAFRDSATGPNQDSVEALRHPNSVEKGVASWFAAYWRPQYVGWLWDFGLLMFETLS